MALHGIIAVNGHTIGGWSARRTEPLDGRSEPYTYECDVQIHGPRGRAASRSTFTVQHCHGDGAVSLAAKVLSHG